MNEANQARAGERMRAEVAEQPGVFDALLAARGEFATVARQVVDRAPRFALLAARGSSDHAALYAKYLIEVLLGIPAGLVSPSTVTLYGAQPDLTDTLLITVSQSGGSPDLVEFTATARDRGATTVAVTNTADSPLDNAAELAVHVRAGTEHAVAATKSYSATLLALYLLVDAARGGDGRHAHPLPKLAEQCLRECERGVAEARARYRFVERVVTTGRGFSVVTAHEAALKLAETSYLSARSYSAADLLHGPVAAVDANTAVLAISSTGKGGEALLPALDSLHRTGADLCTIGSRPTPTTHHIPVPNCAEEVAPILEVLPIQRLALELALSRGANPDQPRGLSKVTRTR